VLNQVPGYGHVHGHATVRSEIQTSTRAWARSGQKFKLLPGHRHSSVRNSNIYPGTGTVRSEIQTPTRAREQVSPKCQARSIPMNATQVLIFFHSRVIVIQSRSTLCYSLTVAGKTVNLAWTRLQVELRGLNVRRLMGLQTL
jgi:hypothetical protein